MNVYKVKWYDAFSVEHWQTNEEMRKQSALIIKSVGFIAGKDKKYITLIQNSGNNDSSLGLINIPRKCIIKIKKL